MTVILALLLARLLGATGFGVFSYAIAWVTLLGVPAMLGLEQLVVRDVAASTARGEPARLRGMTKWSFRAVAIVSVASALIGGALVALAGGIPAGGELAFWVAMALVPLTALVRVLQAVVRGFERIVAGYVPELAVMPVLSLVLVVVGVAVVGPAFDAETAIVAHVGAAVVALAAAAWLLRRYLPTHVQAVPAETRGREWLLAAMPLLFISGAHVVNRQTDVVMLGVLDGVAAAGIYAVAARGVQVITFVTYAVSAPLAPRIAGLHATDDHAGLQRVVRASARLIIGASIPLTLVFMVLGPWLLGLFGDEFVAGYPALVVLSLGQVAGALAGPAGVTLLMTGHERGAAVGTGVGAVLNVLLNVLLIPVYGLLGAATATAVATTATGVIHIWMTWRRLGINSTFLARLPRRRG